MSLSWIVCFLCVAGCHQAPLSPVPPLVLEVQAGQNVTLTCNLTSGVDVTWWVVRSGDQQLLPLLTASMNKVGKPTVEFLTEERRINVRTPDVEENSEAALDLDILQVQEEDAGLYFCTGRYRDQVCYRARLLTIRGADGMALREGVSRPCWGSVLLPASVFFIIILILIIVFVLCSGKSRSCGCGSVSRESAVDRREEEELHYSSLKHRAWPRPHGRGLVKEEVTYSTVHSLRNQPGSHDRS